MLRTPLPLPEDIFITDELASRPSKAVNYLQEKRALQQLAASMVDWPDNVLPEFVELAMEMTDAISAGLSLFEDGPNDGIFRWHHVVGKLAAFDGATTPRNYSPCGVALDIREPVLTSHAEKLYSWISDAGIVVPEVLLVPLYIRGDAPLGTLWVVSDQKGHFDSGHARIASELAAFVGIALRIQQTDQRLRQALDAQETLTREMNHRVKNVFAITDSMIRFTARAEGSKQDMADTLSGRLHALADAHALVMTGMQEDQRSTSDLGELMATILRPHEKAFGSSKIKFSGPEISCGERAVSGLSLVLHELATNAVKYGALGSGNGLVEISWKLYDEALNLTWDESGSAPIEGPPEHKGFGTRLIESTVIHQLKGTLARDWRREGVIVEIAVPLAKLAE